MVAMSDELILPCGARLPNRLAKSAMTEGLADAAGVPTPELDRLYRLWSGGGAGLLITGNVQVDRRHLERPGNVVLDAAPDPERRARLAAMAEAGTASGNALWMQINHAGRQTPALINPAPKAPSAVPLGLPGKQFGRPVVLTEAEILDIIERFALAASAAREAGFTGVQVHAAHGYLVSQFLSPRSNQRTDAWGGSLENRARLLLEIVARVRERVGRDFPVSVKLNSADFQRGGFAFEDSLTVAAWLEAATVDLIELSGGSYEQPKMMDMDGLEAPEAPRVATSTAAREAYFIDFAAAMRAHVRAPLMVTGGFRSRGAIEQALDSGSVDLIGLGRPMCVDVDAPRHLLDGSAGLERWEARLALLPKPLHWLRRIDMVRAVDGFAVQYWYYAQLYRLGRTGAADRGLSVLSAMREVEATHRRLAAASA